MSKKIRKISNTSKTASDIYSEVRRGPIVDDVLRKFNPVHPDTTRHIVHLMQMAVMVGQFLDIEEGDGLRTCSLDELELIGLLAGVHDYGKIDDTLRSTLIKPERYDDKDREIMRQHPSFGFRKYCTGSDVEKILAVGCLTHHTFRKNPYPTLSQDEVEFCEMQYRRYPLLRRFCALLCVVDAFEALVTDPAREYLKGIGPYSWTEAIQMVSVDLNTDDLGIIEVINIIRINGKFLTTLSSM